MPTTPPVNIISPKHFPNEPWNESEVLGAITWLWHQSPSYRQAPIAEMMTYILPVLKNGQFALFSIGAQPIGYPSWAYFDEVGQAHYLQSDRYLRDNSDWNCGDKNWIIQWFAPLGHSRLMRSAGRRLFPNTTLHALHHKGSEKGLKVLTFNT